MKRYSDKMCLHLKGDVEPVDIEQYQVFRQDYEKTTEIAPEQSLSLSEGTKKTVTVNAYERNTIARRKCIEYYGTKCQVCGFDFKETYGSEYEGLIEVHHLVPISSIKSEYTVDPINDLIPLCPNCHTAIHKRIENRYLTVEELRELVLNSR